MVVLWVLAVWGVLELVFNVLPRVSAVLFDCLVCGVCMSLLLLVLPVRSLCARCAASSGARTRSRKGAPRHADSARTAR